MEKVKKLITECKTLIEQNEPFQKKMKAKHSRLKKRVIGHGGQANTPPYSEKPSMKRSKSAPPIGEGIMDLLNKYRKYAVAATLSVGIAAGLNTTAAASKNIQPTKQLSSQQENAENKYLKFYDALLLQTLPSKEQNVEEWQNKIKLNMKSKFGLNDQAIDSIMKDLGTQSKNGEPLNINQAIQRVAMFSKLAADYEIQHEKDENYKTFNAIVHALQQLEQQGYINERVVKRGSKYCLLSKETNKNLGCSTSRKGAEDREREVQYFKHAKKKS
jgi:hypothetical protein